ncbi:hypothetical protein ACJIZ3_022967 [Penstemon smallii]|uniref:S-adenosyl-L-methionine-dependent methyltransferase n=1 Tax=Penstemon smallii TaxID=265156 RepID=A0ABD3TP07_9LAMI
MEVLMHSQPTATLFLRTQNAIPSKRAFRIKTRNRVFYAKLNKEEDDHFFQAAMERTSLRFLETLRPDPLFVDPYIGCLLPLGIEMDRNQGLHNHCLATKFIDDKLLDIMKKNDGLRQVVLLTDGMDTRPYRINWPASSVIFDVSPDRIFTSSSQKLQDVGAKIPRSCLYLHVSSETSNIQQVLRMKGFNGARPSLWVLQGFPIMTLADFKGILDAVGSLSMKGSLFLGELPVWLGETEIGVKSTMMRWMDKLFMTHGLRVAIIKYDEVAKDNGKELTTDDSRHILFVAEQLQFSDDQMEIWRREFQRIEEEGDEEGFEEL